MERIDLTREDFERLLQNEVADLDATSRSVLEQHKVPAFRVLHEIKGLNGPAMLPLWVIARAGILVLAYDEVEEEYGIGDLAGDGTVRDWGTYGERLRGSLNRFPTRDSSSA